MKKVVKKFFYNANGEFKVPYFWATVLIGSFVGVVWAGIITGKERPVATTTLGGMALALIALYNWGKKKSS